MDSIRRKSDQQRLYADMYKSIDLETRHEVNASGASVEVEFEVDSEYSSDSHSDSDRDEPGITRNKVKRRGIRRNFALRQEAIDVMHTFDL